MTIFQLIVSIALGVLTFTNLIYIIFINYYVWDKEFRERKISKTAEKRAKEFIQNTNLRPASTIIEDMYNTAQRAAFVNDYLNNTEETVKEEKTIDMPLTGDKVIDEITEDGDENNIVFLPSKKEHTLHSIRDNIINYKEMERTPIPEDPPFIDYNYKVKNPYKITDQKMIDLIEENRHNMTVKQYERLMNKYSKEKCV